MRSIANKPTLHTSNSTTSRELVKLLRRYFEGVITKDQYVAQRKQVLSGAKIVSKVSKK